jgi:hypothetical protein
MEIGFISLNIIIIIIISFRQKRHWNTATLSCLHNLKTKVVISFVH